MIRFGNQFQRTGGFKVSSRSMESLESGTTDIFCSFEKQNLNKRVEDSFFLLLLLLQNPFSSIWDLYSCIPPLFSLLAKNNEQKAREESKIEISTKINEIHPIKSTFYPKYKSSSLLKWLQNYSLHISRDNLHPSRCPVPNQPK